METENKKEVKIRNASGISAYDKAYYANYASKKTKEMIFCDICKKHISYYSVSKHNRSIKHLAKRETI